jgi:hypothetical protein
MVEGCFHERLDPWAPRDGLLDEAGRERHEPWDDVDLRIDTSGRNEEQSCEQLLSRLAAVGALPHADPG